MKLYFKWFFTFVQVLFLLGFLSCSSGGDSYENLTRDNDSSKSKAIVSVVKNIESLMKEKNWAGIYDIVLPELKKTISVEKCMEQYEHVTKTYGVIDALDIKEIHRVKNSGESFGPIKGESLILPSPIELFPPGAGVYSFVLCETKSRETGFSCWLTLALKKQGQHWYLSSFYMTPSKINGHKGEALIKLGEDFSRKNERRNAYLYTLLGYQISQPGPLITSPPLQKTYEDFLAQPAPPNLPFEGVRSSEVWTTGTGKMSVEYVGHVGLSPFMRLEIRYKTIAENLESPDAAAERNALFDYTIKTFPEYKQAFDGIYIASVSLTGSTFREYFKLKESH